MKNTLSHLKNMSPLMVDIGEKPLSLRRAVAQALVKLPKEITDLFTEGELITKKGPVFNTATIAGIMAVKHTPSLIPLCHQINVTTANISLSITEPGLIEVICEVHCKDKTGVEIEALTGATVASLTIIDMCKSLSKELEIINIKVLEKVKTELT